ncbi:MAG TPA: hypothetical protein VJR27_04580 [Candidatus Saccharimonadales bacterium]|nr:hypothetical protein [Candidatus Saccharimonadales bacterium]
MNDFKKESRNQNKQNGSEHINSAPDHQTPILASTSQREVKTKTQIKLSSEGFKHTRWLYKQYGRKTPSWLRKTFVLNQYRRKSLNDMLHEAQLDDAFCGKYAGTNEWHDQLHLVWHAINRRPSCK